MRAGYGSKYLQVKKEKSNNQSWLLIQGFLIQSHPLTNLDIQKYYQNDLKFNGGLFQRQST